MGWLVWSTGVSLFSSWLEGRIGWSIVQEGDGVSHIWETHFPCSCVKQVIFNGYRKGLHASCSHTPDYHLGKVESHVRELCMQNTCAHVKASLWPPPKKKLLVFLFTSQFLWKWVWMLACQFQNVKQWCRKGHWGSRVSKAIRPSDKRFWRSILPH